LLVHERVCDDFVARFVERANRIRVGHALDLETQLGPLITAAHRDRVLNHIKHGLETGGRLVAGGRAPALDATLAEGTSSRYGR
jgi:acyl-CoA reductase-like NAD-dependent aldehyde dehydrogenase